MSSVSITSINHRKKKLSKSNSFFDKAFILKPAEGEAGTCIRKRWVSKGSETHGEFSMCEMLIRTMVNQCWCVLGSLPELQENRGLCGNVYFSTEVTLTKECFSATAPCKMQKTWWSERTWTSGTFKAILQNIVKHICCDSLFALWFFFFL